MAINSVPFMVVKLALECSYSNCMASISIVCDVKPGPSHRLASSRAQETSLTILSTCPERFVYYKGILDLHVSVQYTLIMVSF